HCKPAEAAGFPCLSRESGYKPAHLTRKHGLIAVRWHPGCTAESSARTLVCSHASGGNNRRIDTMALPEFSMRQLLEAGVHFGHQSHRWNPKMADYIFGARNNIHIIDLAQTVPLLHNALKAVSDTVAKGGRILFVGTKRQAQDGV